VDRQKGFSVSELLIVLAIIVIIGGIAIPSLMRASRNAVSLQEVGCDIGETARACTDSLDRRIAEVTVADSAAWAELQDALKQPITLTPEATEAWAYLQKNVAILRARQLRTHREFQRIRRLAEYYTVAARDAQ
jgi:prepilin-type N-terminal cleavage/methylation domain-containing protein